MSKKKSASSDRVVVFSVGLVLFLLGACFLLLVHARSAGNLLRQHMDIVAELEPGAALQDRERAKQLLLSIPAIEASSIRFVSKDDAAQEMQANYLDGVEMLDNPFADLYTFNIEAASYTDGYLAALKTQLEAKPTIAAVYYKNDLTENVSANINTAAYALLLLCAFFSVLAIMLIINTLQLRLHADRLEIKTMQTVGAQPSFIKKPYLHTAARTALQASAWAALALLALLAALSFYLPKLGAMISWIWVAITLALITIAAIALLLAVTNTKLNTYLRASISDII